MLVRMQKCAADWAPNKAGALMLSQLPEQTLAAADRRLQQQQLLRCRTRQQRTSRSSLQVLLRRAALSAVRVVDRRCSQATGRSGRVSTEAMLRGVGAVAIKSRHVSKAWRLRSR